MRDHFTKFSRIYQWFQTLIHPALIQRRFFYVVLIDLGDAVADELSLPFDSISFEMIYRGLSHFSVAYKKV